MINTNPKLKRNNWVEARITKTSNSFDQAIKEGLTQYVFNNRNEKNVKLIDGTEAIEFVSCSYLGLETHDKLIEGAKAALDKYGLHFSSSRNRFRPPFLDQFESLLSEIHDDKPTLAFTSVSSVHLGILPLLGNGSLPSYPVSEKGAYFLIEKTAHASLQVLRGIYEQLGPVKRFDLNEPGSLEKELAEVNGRTPIVLVDGVGSMGGLIDLHSILQLVNLYNGYLYIDDAHGTSIIGEKGAGYAFSSFKKDIPYNVIIAGSLSKAFGGTGGYVVLNDQNDKDIIKKVANPLVFGHSIPLPMLAANVEAAKLHLNGEVRDLQKRLWDNTNYLDKLTHNKLFNNSLKSPIRAAVFNTEEQGFMVAKKLKEEGILILPAFFPTVASGTSLIRLAVSALHKEDELEVAANVLNEYI